MDVFFIEDDEFLENYNRIWNEVSNSIRKELGCRPINNKKFLKTKIRSYGGEATDFHNKEMPPLGSSYTYLAVISINFVSKKDENCYQQVFLKE